jgi:hypothetical protein
LIF